MPSTLVSLTESELIRVILEFLGSRDLNISMLSLERETGVINGEYSDDILFLRQLILDGHWDDALDFVQPLSSVDNFDMKKFKYTVLRHKYLELLCIKSEPGGAAEEAQFTVEEVLSTLRALEEYCADTRDYQKLTYLLSVPKLSAEPEFHDWNPSLARVQCFKQLLPLVSSLLGAQKAAGEPPRAATDDRLISLVVKGLLYETCVELCQRKAIDDSESSPRMSSLLDANNSGISDADLSLLSWLQCLPSTAFSHPFQQQQLRVQVRRLHKPRLEASWTDHILSTPIQPQVFPHSALPSKPRRTSLLSRSLNPQYDGQTGVLPSTEKPDVHLMSKSTTSFQLPSRAHEMRSSVSKLIERSPQHSTNTNGHNQTRRSPSPEQASVRQSGTDLFKEYQRQREQLQAQLDERQTNRQQLIHQIQADTRTGHAPQTDKRTGHAPQPDSSPRQPDFRTDHPSQPDKPKDTRTDVQGDPRGSSDSGQQSQSNQNRSTGSSRNAAPPSVSNAPPAVPNPSKPAGPDPSASRGAAGSPRGTPGSRPVSKDSDVQSPGSVSTSSRSPVEDQKAQFRALCSIEDPQAVRAAAVHPHGHVFAIGSNSKTLRVCAYPETVRSDGAADVLFRRSRYHKGSIYCLAWNSEGNLLASGSNDKCVRLLKYDTSTNSATEPETEWSFHEGTVRDVLFLEARSPLLASAGAGERIHLTDCLTGTCVRKLDGHNGTIYALCALGAGSDELCSASQDRSVRLWDTRCQTATRVISDCYSSAPASVSADPSAQVLATGHEDGSVCLYDVRGGRLLQKLEYHSGETRTVRFSTTALYLLTGSYDSHICLADLHGDLLESIPVVRVAKHEDKIIQCSWHPTKLSFVSTSADRRAVVWSMD